MWTALKYYHRIWLYLIILSLGCPISICASAWLPEKGQYKHTITSLAIDSKSRSALSQRERMFKQLESLHYHKNKEREGLAKLNKQLKIKENTNGLTIFESNNPSGNTNYRDNADAINAKHEKLLNDKIELTEAVQQQEREIKKIEHKIQEITDAIEALYHNQDLSFTSTEIEYGVSDTQSFGINLQYRQHRFTKLKYERAAEVFIKKKIFHSAKHIVSVQPRLIITKGFNQPEEVLGEVSFLFGKSHKIRQKSNNQKRQREFFSDMAFTIGGCINNRRDNRYFSLAISEGIKFADRFTLANYTKYTYSPDLHDACQKITYDQLSIIKELKFKRHKTRKLSIQAGYFWKHSFKYKSYSISGPILSIWYES